MYVHARSDIYKLQLPVRIPLENTIPPNNLKSFSLLHIVHTVH